MRKRFAFVLVSAIILNSVAFGFSDLEESHWAYSNIMNMYNKGLVSGFLDDTFRPADTLTRAQFITMVEKGLKANGNVDTNYFEDVNNHWAAIYINSIGSIMCDGDINFRPDDDALREDVAMALVKFYHLENSAYNLEILNKFSDSKDISENRKKYIAIAVENGFMSGNIDGTFKPKKALTRAEGTTVIFNRINAEYDAGSEIVSLIDFDKQEGVYTMGDNKAYFSDDSEMGTGLYQFKKSVKLSIEGIIDGAPRFSIGGFSDGTIFAISGIIEFSDGKWKYFSDDVCKIEIEPKEDMVIVTGVIEETRPLSGVYKKE